MKDILFQYLKNYTNAPDEVLKEVIEHLPVRYFKKGTVLLEQGDVSSKCYFILKGLIRQFSIDTDGNENTSNFYSENQVASVYNPQRPHEASRYSLACLEDSILLDGDLNDETQMYAKYPFLETMVRKMLEKSRPIFMMIMRICSLPVRKKGIGHYWKSARDLPSAFRKTNWQAS